MKNILVIGSTSKIAEACLRLWAIKKCEFFLVARNIKKNEILSESLKNLGARNVYNYTMDLNHLNLHNKMYEDACSKLSNIDLVFIAHGTLPNQSDIQNDEKDILDTINTNALSVINLLTIIAKDFESKKQGHIAILSSVAADRGRESNYIYGSSKAMITVFAEGLGQRLKKSNIDLTIIKPGIIDTPMTNELKKNFLWSSPNKIATKIIKAIEKKRSEVYVPSFWFIIMLIVKFIPNFIFKKLKF